MTKFLSGQNVEGQTNNTALLYYTLYIFCPFPNDNSHHYFFCWRQQQGMKKGFWSLFFVYI